MVSMESECECGHKLEDHHGSQICDGLVREGERIVSYDPSKHEKFKTASIRTSWYCLENRTDFPHAHGEECEHWGFNETGGLMLVDDNGQPIELLVDENGNRTFPENITYWWKDHCRSFKNANYEIRIIT